MLALLLCRRLCKGLGRSKPYSRFVESGGVETSRAPIFDFRRKRGKMNLETTVKIHEPGTLQTVVNGMVSPNGATMRVDSVGGYTEVAPGVRIHNSPPPSGTTMVIHNVAPIAMPSHAMPGGETYMVVHEPVKPIAPVESSKLGSAIVDPVNVAATIKPTTKKAAKKAAKKVAKKRIR